MQNALHLYKLHVKLFYVNKFVSNSLMVKFNLKKHIVKFYNDEAIAIQPRKGNFYKINFVKVDEMDAANLLQCPTGHGALEL